MGMRVSTNIAAVNAQRNLVSSQRVMSKSMSQLASGSVSISQQMMPQVWPSLKD